MLTPHHTKYYEGKPGYESASDTVEPVPVFFPAVKEQGENDYFTFPLIPLRRADPADLAFAKRALRTGLENFGIGAKTNAGYGWFEDITAAIESQKENLEKLGSAKADTRIADELRANPKDQLRGILNKFEFDQERFWPQQEPENTYEFQVTLLELHLEDATLLSEAMSVKKGKKALLNLAKKMSSNPWQRCQCANRKL